MQTNIRGMQLYVIIHGYKRLYRFVLMFLYCFRPWPYTRNVLTYCRDRADSVTLPTYSVIYSKKYALW